MTLLSCYILYFNGDILKILYTFQGSSQVSGIIRRFKKD